ncbi:unnamed protein product [Mytilus coruscus]|uniref:DZIP3-like HEPN domain-containing protein n=1 Tax=Mytilus coruscus TaxID=42192 RepID=A0A6J8AEJ6_MYTCO|nr:unnamed protein product [Mytilus coruscus]
MEEIVVLTSLIIFQIFVLKVVSYSLKCPSQANWKLRAQVACNSSLKYFCLYNSVIGEYVEGCNGPDRDRIGSKRIYAGDFSRGYCTKQRFQPFVFWTNDGVSDCIYAKSICSEEGQVVYKDHSSRDDRACRCDHKKSYSFIENPRDNCFCIPTKEDCSCYVKSCPVNQTLSADYSCIQTGINEILIHKCRDTIEYNKTVDEKTISCIENNRLCFSKPKNDHVRVRKERLDVDVHQSLECVRLKKDEVNYLRLIHLLFRVACPVVRTIFNHEIHPNQLRRTLYKNKREIEKIYRRKDKIVDEYQWNLLFGHSKEETVTSEDFGVRLMIYLLRIIANINVGDLYPVPSDTSIGAMLSRIKFIRNEVTQSLEGKIPENQFNQYWDDIGQAVLKLMSSFEMYFENYQLNKGLTDRLFMLNPINIDTREVCLFIDMSEKYPAMILEQLFSEYCTFERVTIEDILRNEKHDLYHKRIKTESCCKCSTKQVSTFLKVMSEKQWGALYEISMSSNSHLCPSDLTKCSERFIPKTINTSDLSKIMTLVLYSQNMMHYIVSRLFGKGFSKFLLNNQHTLYHSMDKKRCCKCRKSPTEEILINKEEWNTLFLKENDILCKNDTTDCCCQYSVRRKIRYSDIDETVLFKIVYLAGPIGVLNKIKRDAFLCFINWTVDVDLLSSVLTELLKIIEDKTFRSDMLRRISSDNLSQSYETEAKSTDAYQWVSKHLCKQKATTEPPLQIFVRDKDVLRVRSVHIPHDLTLPDRTRNFTDITSEENNFLVVVHGLSKIVYPIVINEFNTHCRHHMFNAIRRDIFEQRCKSPNYNEHRDQRKRMYLSQKQQTQLFSPRQEESKIVDLKLMIYILKENTNGEEKKDYFEQLDVIDEIRREIVQSSSGILKEERFQEVMERIRKAVLHLGGKSYMEKLSSLKRIQNILE